ncbi:hypothetical protein M8J77_026381 [Diaphorina citri]|nr:hypothetical protein M8J77_026381 [Diaphorina citri]
MSSRKMKLCDFCGKLIEVSNLSRHHKLCSMKPPSDETVSKFTCNECGKSFSRKDNLKRHSNHCQSVSLKKTKLQCNFPGCSVLFSTRIDLIDHMVGMHQLSSIQSCQFKEFNSHREFLKWKETEEQLTYSYFSQKGGSSGNTAYFYCQKDGSAKAHRKNDEVDRLTDRKNAKGQIKHGKYCISSMKVVVCPHTNLTKVWYFPTHNHSLDVSDILHQPMSRETSQYIQEEIVNTSSMDVVWNVENSAQQVEADTPLLRDECKMRIVENLKKLLETVDSNSSNWSSHLLCKVDTDIESIMKNITASVPVCPTMTPTSTITPSQKLKTQDSQLLPLKRIKRRRRKPSDVAALTLQKKAVLEDLKLYIPVEKEEASSSDLGGAEC